MKLLHHRVMLHNSTGPLTIIPIGCIHADDQGFNESLFKQCIDEIKATPDCVVIGLGDFSNFLRTTARKHLQSYTGDEDSWRDLDQMVRKKAEEFVEKWLMPIRGKILGLAEGNHFHKFVSGETDTQYMCQLLEVPYLEKPAFVRLQVCSHLKRTLRVLKLLIHHGDWSGGTTRTGGDVNALENKGMGFDFDVFIASHTHRRYGMHLPVLTIPGSGRLKVIERPRVFIRTGTFMRGYVEHCQGRYVDKKLLPPTDLGYVRLLVHFQSFYDAERYKSLRVDHTRGQSRYAKTNLTHRFEIRI